MADATEEVVENRCGVCDYRIPDHQRFCFECARARSEAGEVTDSVAGDLIGGSYLKTIAVGSVPLAAAMAVIVGLGHLAMTYPAVFQVAVLIFGFVTLAYLTGSLIALEWNLRGDD